MKKANPYETFLNFDIGSVEEIGFWPCGLTQKGPPKTMSTGEPRGKTVAGFHRRLKNH